MVLHRRRQPTELYGVVLIWLYSSFCKSKLTAHAAVVDVPLLQTAAWAISSPTSYACAVRPQFDNCTDPWSVAQAWWYVAGNVLAASSYASGSSSSVPTEVTKDAKKMVQHLTAFFATPQQRSFSRSARRAYNLHDHLLGNETSAPIVLRKLQLDVPDTVGVGVPFPVTSVMVDYASSALQLRSGSAMPLLGLATSRDCRPSISGMAQALKLGVRHVELNPGVASSVGKAIADSGISRSDIFLSVIWELPLNSEERFKVMLIDLQVSRVDLVQVPRGPDIKNIWKIVKSLKSQGLIRTLGVRDYSDEELAKVGGGIIDEIEYAQCKFSPYRPGPTRHTWQGFGRRSIALAASAVVSDWPHVLSPSDDPHLQGVARRVKRSVPQVLIRWALQLGLAVVFKSQNSKHIEENMATLGFVLPEGEMRLISGLATLAQPWKPPGDGFAHVYTRKNSVQAGARGVEL